MKALHKQFVQTQGLQDLTEAAQRIICDQLNTLQCSQTSTLDLYNVVRKTIFHATLRIAISESKSVANDDFIALFECFDKAIPKAFAGLPLRYVASESYKAREQLVKILQSDSFVPSNYLKDRRQFLLAKGMSRDDVARDNLLWVWGAGTNFVPSQFWHIYHIITHKDAMEGIRKEVQDIISQRDDDDHFDGTFTSQELERMVGLESAFKESNRLTMTNMIAREVMHDMDLDLRLDQPGGGKYFLEQGSQILLYPPLLHQDPCVFEAPKEYRWNRFILGTQFKNSSGQVLQDPFRGFGGGAHYCPGRKLATNMAKAFAATLVYQYNMELVGSPTEYDLARDAFGVLYPKSHVDICFTPRKL